MPRPKLQTNRLVDRRMNYAKLNARTPLKYTYSVSKVNWSPKRLEKGWVFFFGLSNSVRCLCVLFRNGIFSTDVLQFLAVRNDRAVTSLVFYEGRRSHFSKTCEDQEAFLFLFFLKKKSFEWSKIFSGPTSRLFLYFSGSTSVHWRYFCWWRRWCPGASKQRTTEAKVRECRSFVIIKFSCKQMMFQRNVTVA